VLVSSGTRRGADQSAARARILAATFEVLSRNGPAKLNLSDVAAQAGVSRRTLYRWFSSKEDLLTAFALYEQHEFDTGVAKATDGLDGQDRLDAVLRFIVDYQRSYSLGRMVDVEPEYVLQQISRVVPIMRRRVRRLVTGPDADVAAATMARVAVCHYLIGSDDGDQFLAQLRQAVGIDPSRRLPSVNTKRPAKR
jgi:AcrR family transcriptional regulator